MPPIVLYSKSSCPYCHAAKELLRRKGATFTEIDISGDASARAEMLARSGGVSTVPQIFIGTTHVGGCDDLYALEEKGQLDPLLVA
ncbi:glutaredoxin 3 [Blastochloris viridis]|uniref:Glutaredoxin n=1 Tax=Blastochloris viridis TaxID=1079 RepID=A0A0H5B8T4_BLAVI|nr:glutaredoxin 3 [Blastochloris viridis]ALK08109.1 Glutaredoxin-3 [Blastochloris viridis]BAR98627.1 glutaredoxin 3, Grx3 [Blastochloris viridis]CUU44031.1 Glutaredoxin-3 [Blastochloris viridis]